MVGFRSEKNPYGDRGGDTQISGKGHGSLQFSGQEEIQHRKTDNQQAGDGLGTFRVGMTSVPVPFPLQREQPTA